MDAREVALLTLNACERQGGWSDGVLKKQIAAAGLDSRDAGLATQLCFGVIQNRILLDFYLSKFSNIPLRRLEGKVLQALRLGLYQMLFLTRIPHSAAVDQSVALTRTHCKNPRAPGMVNAILRNLERSLDRLPTIPEDDPAEYYATLYSHPVWLVRELLETLGSEGTAAFLQADNSQPPITAMVNTENGSGGGAGGPPGGGGPRGAPPLAEKLSGPLPQRQPGGAGRLPERPLLRPGPRLPAGGTDPGPGAGGQGAGYVRRPRGKILRRRHPDEGSGGDLVLRPAPPQKDPHPEGGPAPGPHLHPAPDRRRQGAPPGVGGGL